MDRGFKGNMGQACWGSQLYTDGLMAGIWHVTPQARRRNVRKDVTRQEIASKHIDERYVQQPTERLPLYTNKLHSVRHGSSKPG